jgi:hypothetical protein
VKLLAKELLLFVAPSFGKPCMIMPASFSPEKYLFSNVLFLKK